MKKFGLLFILLLNLLCASQTLASSNTNTDSNDIHENITTKKDGDDNNEGSGSSEDVNSDNVETNDILFNKSYLDDSNFLALMGSEVGLSVLRFLQELDCSTLSGDGRTILSGVVLSSVFNYIVTPIITPLILRYNLYYGYLVPFALSTIWGDLTVKDTVDFGGSFGLDYYYDNYVEDGVNKKTFTNYWTGNALILSGVLKSLYCSAK